MGEVNLVIDGRAYGIACDEGQEQRVQQLGRYIDQRLREISNGSGANNKAQMMVLTALLLADEVFDMKDQVSRVANTNKQLQAAPQQTVYQGIPPKEEKEITDAISKLAAKVERLAKKVQKA